MASYLDQLARTRRLLGRLENQGRSTVDYDDDVWTFFQNCWHLKDWVKNDRNLDEGVRTAIEDIASKSLQLRICADLANGSKHLLLTTPREGARHSHRILEVIAGEPDKTRIQYFIDNGRDGKLDALALARRCLAEWEAVLKSLGLKIES